MIVPIGGIGAGRYQANHRGPELCRFSGLADPFANISAIRRVHPAHPLPELFQAVDARRIEPGAFGIFKEGAHVKGKPELGVKLREQGGRRLPLLPLAAVHDRDALAAAVGGLSLGVGLVLAAASYGSAPLPLVNIVTVFALQYSPACRRQYHRN